MIRDHAFNSAWWKGRAGILEDPRFFALSEAERGDALASWDWVEFRSPFAAAPDPWLLARSGFAYADTQIGFRIALAAVPEYADAAGLVLRFADESPFTLEAKDLPPFPHERFQFLPGATPERLVERYALFGREILAKSPKWCVAVGDPGAPQGWFLAEPDGERLHLALAMLRRGSSLSGHYLYAAALRAFAARGARLGQARFSIRNGPVHNIYSQLGAVFREATGVWLWAAGR